MLTNKDNKEYKINSFNVRSIIILSTFAILLLYLSNTFLFENIKQAWAYPVVANITVGAQPIGVAYDSNDSRVYVANVISNTVSVIDTSTNTVIATIGVGSHPQDVAYDSKDGRVYVTNFGSNNVSVIDTKTNTVISTIPVGTNPAGVAYDSDDGRVYVTDNSNPGSISVIDTKTNTVNATIGVGNNPWSVAYDSKDGRVYVANLASNTVSVIDTSTNTVIATIGVGNGPTGVAYGPDDGRVYVTNQISNTVSVIDTKTNTVNATIGVGNGPTGVAYDPDDGRVYVSNRFSNTVSVIDTSTNTVNATIGVGSQPVGIAYDSDDGRVYVANVGSNTVSVIATSQYPHHTTITSAVDGNNNPVQNGSSTLSTSITFNLRAIPGVNPIAGFQCSLDNTPFTSCGTANANPTPVTYNNLQPGQHVFKVRAVDSQGNVDSNPATFRWFIMQQILPLANAGSNQVVQSFQTVNLNGSASFDPNGFTPLTYKWTQISGPTVSLSNPTSSNPSFIAPGFSRSIQLTFELIVTNTQGIHSNPSFVTITVTPVSLPIANAGPNQQVQSSQSVNLDGSASFDPNGSTPLTYSWTQTSGTPVSLSSSTSATPSFVAPTVNQDTTLTFKLVVTNSQGVQSNPSFVVFVLMP